MINQLILTFIFFSLNLKSANTIIGGHINEVTTGQVILKYYPTSIDYINGQSITLESEIDKNGDFKFEIITNAPFTFNLLLNKDWLMINKFSEQGDSLWIDYSKTKTAISGRGEFSNEFIYEFEDAFFTKSQIKEFNENYKLLNPKDYAFYWRERHKKQLEFLRNYPKKLKLSQSFIDYYKAEIDYRYGISMLQYCFKHSLELKTLDSIVNNPKYMSFLNEIEVDSKTSLNNPIYINFIRELPNILWTALVDNQSISKEQRDFYLKNQYSIRDSFAKKYFKKNTYDYALYSILNDAVESLDSYKGSSKFNDEFNRVQVFLENYKTKFSDPQFKVILSNKLNWLKTDNIVAPDFTAMDMNGNEIKLSSLKGKVIYLDFWSTNCAPCIAEIPYHKKLKDRFTNENVVFLSVALDNSKEKVEKIIKSKSYEGTHLIETNGFGSTVSKLYSITSIPRFVIIDKNGRIVNIDAPSPRNNPDEIIKTALKIN